MHLNAFSIFDQMLEGVQVIDPHGRYLYVNDALVAHSKKSKQELVGNTMSECYPGIEQTPLFRRIQECLQKKQSQEWINEFNFPDGSKGYFQLRMTPVKEGVLIMSFDITQQKKAEDLIRSANSYLEEIVRTRTEELQEQKRIIEKQLQDLKEMNATKDKFFSIVAHDLVSPLHSLKGLTNIMAAGPKNLSGPEFRETLSSLHRSVENTLALAQNLVAWAGSQMSSIQKATLEDVSINDMVREVYGLYKELAQRKGILLDYRVGDDLVVTADKNQLTFVVRNLVNNAIKYTNPQGFVKITAESHHTNKVLIAVSDNGMGMAADVLNKIRNIDIDRSLTGTAGEKGTGVGLFLCNEFIKQNNGELEIESEEGIGSTFNLYLHTPRAEYHSANAIGQNAL